MIVATNHHAADEAAKLVVVQYEKPATKPLLTPQDLLAAQRKDRIKHQSSIIPKTTGM